MEKLKLNLQFFAEQDDPGEDDDDLENLFDTEDDDLNEDDEQQEEEEDAEEEGEEQTSDEDESQADTQQPIQFTPEQQYEINRIVQERLYRDRQSRQPQIELLQQLEAEAGMSVNDIIGYIRHNKIQSEVQARAEAMGISEKEAEAMVAREQEVALLRHQMEQFQQQQEYTSRMFQYNQAKQMFMMDPLVRRYEREIDAFSQNGIAVDFEPAMNFILGEKVRTGELLQSVRSAEQQKTLANVQKRSRVQPETGAVTGGKNPATALSQQEKQIAAILGISPKDYAEQKARKR